MIKDKKHKSKNSKNTKNHKNPQKQKQKQTKQVQIPKPEGRRKEKRIGKSNGLLWCPVPYVWGLDLLNSNHV